MAEDGHQFLGRGRCICPDGRTVLALEGREGNPAVPDVLSVLVPPQGDVGTAAVDRDGSLGVLGVGFHANGAVLESRRVYAHFKQRAQEALERLLVGFLQRCQGKLCATKDL
ncbi:hypothetical protein D3C73_1183510 [compost metagenome]